MTFNLPWKRYLTWESGAETSSSTQRQNQVKLTANPRLVFQELCNPGKASEPLTSNEPKTIPKWFKAFDKLLEWINSVNFSLIEI